jgi:hypothetical protein
VTDFVPICMRPADAARYLNIPKSTLDKSRLRGDGPRYVKFRRVVLYRLSDLDDWLARKTRRSTSEDPMAA